MKEKKNTHTLPLNHVKKYLNTSVDQSQNKNKILQIFWKPAKLIAFKINVFILFLRQSIR